MPAGKWELLADQSGKPVLLTLSAYYAPTESQFPGTPVPIKANEAARRNSGGGNYLSKVYPYYAVEEKDAQTASENFLFESESVCLQGMGRLNNGRYISCTEPRDWSGMPTPERRATIGFEWKTNYEKHKAFLTAAVCKSGRIPSDGSARIYIPKLMPFLMGKPGATDGVLTVNDTGEGLCRSPYNVLDVFVGTGSEGFRAYKELVNMTSTNVIQEPVEVYIQK